MRTSQRSLRRKAFRDLSRYAQLSSSNPRLGLDSGRDGHWFLGIGCSNEQHKSWGWWRYAAARRSLALAGYDDATARDIARQAAICDRCVFAPRDLPEPPPGSTEGECYGWDMRIDHGEPRSADNARRVRQWTGWFASLSNDDAVIGRRMRRWIAACVEHQETERAKRRAASEHTQAEWLAGQSADVQAIYATGAVRCGCLRVHGTSVTEALHDVGGAMTFLSSGRDLVEMQRQHDEVYHAGDHHWYPRVTNG